MPTSLLSSLHVLQAFSWIVPAKTAVPPRKFHPEDCNQTDESPRQEQVRKRVKGFQTEPASCKPVTDIHVQCQLPSLAQPPSASCAATADAPGSAADYPNTPLQESKTAGSLQRLHQTSCTSQPAPQPESIVHCLGQGSTVKTQAAATWVPDAITAVQDGEQLAAMQAPDTPPLHWVSPQAARSLLALVSLSTPPLQSQPNPLCEQYQASGHSTAASAGGSESGSLTANMAQTPQSPPLTTPPFHTMPSGALDSASLPMRHADECLYGLSQALEDAAPQAHRQQVGSQADQAATSSAFASAVVPLACPLVLPCHQSDAQAALLPCSKEQPEPHMQEPHAGASIPADASLLPTEQAMADGSGLLCLELHDEAQLADAMPARQSKVSSCQMIMGNVVA